MQDILRNSYEIARATGKQFVDQICLMNAYENVLKQRHIDTLTDGHFYRLVLKIQQCQEDPFLALEREAAKQSQNELSFLHHYKYLMAKAYFSLVKNMVNKPPLSTKGSVESQKSSARRSLKRDKENMSNTQKVKRKSKGKKQTEKSKNKTSVLKEFNFQTQKRNCDDLRKMQEVNAYQQEDDKIYVQAIGKPTLHAHSSIVSADTGNLTGSELYQKAMNPSVTCYTTDQAELTSNTDNKCSRFNYTSSSASGLFKSKGFSSKETKYSMEDFKLKLKCLRLWKSYILENRRNAKMHQNQEQDVQSWAMSIHFNEQNQLLDSFLRLAEYAKQKRKLKKAANVIRVVRAIKQQRKFFGLWQKVCGKVGQKKQNLYKSLDFWSGNKKLKCFNAWKTQNLVRKHLQYVTIDKLMEKPSSIGILVNWFQKVKRVQIRKDDSFGVKLQKLGVKNKQFREFVVSGLQREQYLKTLNALKINRELRLEFQEKAYFQRQRILFSAWSKISSKIAFLHYNHNKISEHLSKKLKLQFFGHWMQMTGSKFNMKINNQKAMEFRKFNLLSKSFYQGLIQFCGQRLAKKSQLKESIQTKLSRKTQRCFEGWKFITVYNKASRRISKQVKQASEHYQLKHFFIEWVKQAINECKAKQHYQRHLIKVGFEQISQYMDQRYDRYLLNKASYNKYLLSLQKQVIFEWRKNVLKQKKNRYLRRYVFKFLEEQLQKKVLLSLRDYIQRKQEKDQIKNLAQVNYQGFVKKKVWDALRGYLCYSQDMLLKQQSIQTYHLQRQNNCLITQCDAMSSNSQVKESVIQMLGQLEKVQVLHKSPFHTESQELQQQQERSRLCQNFLSWYILMHKRCEQRNHLILLRTLNMNKQVFSGWKQYTNCRLHFRRRLNNLYIQMALHRKQVAFSGLKVFHQDRLLISKKKQAAAFIFLARYLSKVVQALKIPLRHKRVSKLVQLRRNERIAKSMLKIWKQKYIRQDIVKRVELRRKNTVKSAAFHAFGSFKLLSQKNRVKVFKGLQIYGNDLKKQAIKQIQKFIQQKREKQNRMNYHFNLYQKSQVSKAFLALKHYFTFKSQQHRLTKVLIKKSQLITKLNTLYGLKEATSRAKDLRQRLQPVLKNKLRKIKRRCLTAFFAYTFKRSILSSNFEKYQEKERISKLKKCFGGIYENMKRRTWKKQNLQNALLFNQERRKRMVLFGFVKNRVVKEYKGCLFSQYDQKLKVKFFQQWVEEYNERQLDKPYQHEAEIYHKRKNFFRFVMKLQETKVSRLTKDHFFKKSVFHFQNKARKRGIQQLFRFSQTNKISKMKNQLQKTFFQQRMFKKFTLGVDIIRAQNHQIKTAYDFHNFILKMKALKNFYFVNKNSQRLSNCKNKILEKCEQNYKQKAIQGFKSYIKEQKELRVNFASKMKFICPRLLKEYFILWKEVMNEVYDERNAKQFADQYLVSRFSKYWKIGTVLAKKKKTKQRMATEVYHKNRITEAFSAIQFFTQQRKYFKAIFYKINASHQYLYKTLVWSALSYSATCSKALNQVNEQAIQFWKNSVSQKLMYSFQRNKCFGQVQRMIKASRNISTLKSYTQHWQRRMLQNIALRKVVPNLQSKNDTLQKQTFVRRAIKVILYQKIFETVQAKKLERITNAFFSTCKTMIVKKKIVTKTQEQNKQYIKQKVFRCLQMNKKIRDDYRDIVESQINIYQDENNEECLRNVFRAMKQFLLNSKFKKIALKSYAIQIYKSTFKLWQIYSFEQKVEKQKIVHFQHSVLQRNFSQWVESFNNSQKIKLTQKQLQIRTQRQCIQGWKDVVLLQSQIQKFQKLNESKRLKPIAFQGLKEYCNYKQEQERKIMAVKSKSNLRVRKQVIIGLQDLMNLKKLQLNMHVFHQFKIEQAVFDSWAQITQAKNEERKDVIHIRMQLQKNPQYIRPLLVLRSPLLFKYFNKLAINTLSEKEKFVNKGTSRYALYLRLLRKAFVSLKDNRQTKRKYRNARAISKLYLQKRWLENLKSATMIRAQYKKMKTESLIFHFFTLIKKAFQGLSTHATECGRARIKYQFAIELYNKRLLDRSFLSLKLNLEGEKTFHSSLNNKSHSTSQFQQYYSSNPSRVVTQYSNQNLSLREENAKSEAKRRLQQSRLDASNLQVEMSSIMDEVEKERLVEDFFAKKLIFKAFAGWASLVMCYSDEEGNQSKM